VRKQQEGLQRQPGRILPQFRSQCDQEILDQPIDYREPLVGKEKDTQQLQHGIDARISARVRAPGVWRVREAHV
jgi:hypothetical protein